MSKYLYNLTCTHVCQHVEQQHLFYYGFTLLYHSRPPPTQDPRIPQKPVSPNLSRALQNQNIKTASYTLPDGTIIDPRQQVNHDL